MRLAILFGFMIVSVSVLYSADPVQQHAGYNQLRSSEDEKFIDQLPTILAQIIRASKANYTHYINHMVAILFARQINQKQPTNSQRFQYFAGTGKLIGCHNFLVHTNDALWYISPQTTNRIAHDLDELALYNQPVPDRPYSRHMEEENFNTLTISFPHTLRISQCTISHESFRTLAFAAYALQAPLYKSALTTQGSLEDIKTHVKNVLIWALPNTEEHVRQAVTNDIALRFQDIFKQRGSV